MLINRLNRLQSSLWQQDLRLCIRYDSTYATQAALIKGRYQVFLIEAENESDYQHHYGHYHFGHYCKSLSTSLQC